MSNPHTHDIRLSKSLSWLLRHGANSVGLVLDEAGYADIDNILTLKKFKQYSLDDILNVVHHNDKKRFSVRDKPGNTGVLQIRANQGHTLQVNDDELLTMLTEKNAPPRVYHGTYRKNLKSIMRDGLSRMRRNHIHFALLPPSEVVISGMRKDCEVVVVVDVAKAMKDDFKFYKSDNDVVLCGGNENGFLPPCYFKEILELKICNKGCHSK